MQGERKTKLEIVERECDCAMRQMKAERERRARSSCHLKGTPGRAASEVLAILTHLDRTAIQPVWRMLRFGSGER